jgi:hypothetical protein
MLPKVASFYATSGPNLCTNLEGTSATKILLLVVFFYVASVPNLHTDLGG